MVGARLRSRALRPLLVGIAFHALEIDSPRLSIHREIFLTVFFAPILLMHGGNLFIRSDPARSKKFSPLG